MSESSAPPEFRTRRTVTTWRAFSWGFKSFEGEPLSVQNGDAGGRQGVSSLHVLEFQDPATGDMQRFLLDDETRAHIIMSMSRELDVSSKHRLVHFLVGQPPER